MKQPENQSKKYDALFAEIDSGQTKIPKFQREFTWGAERTAILIDSIVKGFPIGTLIFWKTREEMRHYKNIGNVTLPEIPKGDAALYVLDGQQRITSLYAVRKGAIVDEEGKEVDYKQLSINLALSPDTSDQIVTIEPPKDAPCISVFTLLNGSLAELVKEYNTGDLLQKLDIYRARLTGYDFSTIEISDASIDVACEVFSRINTGGTPLTLFEIMVAKTFDPDRKFDLADEYDKLIDSAETQKDLEDADFETIPASTVLQCISTHLTKQTRAKDILHLDKTRFIDAWPLVTNGIFAAVDYLRTQFRIPVSRLLPYDALLVPFTYFFVHKGKEPATALQTKLLTQYFWWASLSNRFSSAVESKLAQDVLRMDMILDGKLPIYPGEEINLTLDRLRTKEFSTGDAFCKAILCLYAYFEPKSFDSNSLVKLDNSWLKVASSKNYHHFFPRAFLTKAGYSREEANTILNITLVDDSLNKRKIQAKAPSIYMKEFAESNDELGQTMKSHLIDDLDAFGVWKDSYGNFIDQRGRRVLEEVTKRLAPKL